MSKKKKEIDLFNQPVPKKEKIKKEVKSCDRDPSVTLNVEQEEALILMKEFRKDKDKTDFVLKGSGGTGKSFLIKELFKRKKQKSDEYYVPSTVIGVCVTHQARLNLMKSIPNTTTYASAANLILMYDPMGNIYFSEKSGSHQLSELKSYSDIVVDECSMFDKQMQENLRKCCNPNAKIIWMGDSSQLPPISACGDNDSPTFDIKDQYELTIKMRQDNEDHIAILADEVISHIKGDKDLSFLNNLTQQYDVTTRKGYSITQFDKVIPSYISNFKKGIDVRITSYRNTRIQSLNTAIRQHLWEEDADKQYVPGDLIIMNSQYSPDRDILAYNGQTFCIQRIYTDMVEFVECFMIVVPRVDRKPKSHETVTLQVPTEKGYPMYKHHLEKLKKEAIKHKEWGEHQQFKNQFADISYGYAVTNYKIQGSTLTGCYVDLSDILSVKPISDKRKLQAFYVGISRPTDFLAIF